MDDQTSAADYVRAALAPESDIGDVSPDVVQQLLAEHDAWRDTAHVRAGQLAQSRAQLAAADTEQAEHAARIGELTPAGTEYRADGPFVHDVSEDHVRSYFTPDGWAEGYRPEQRQLYAGPWRPVETAPGDGPSATETAAQGDGGHGDGSNSRANTAGQTEPTHDGAHPAGFGPIRHKGLRQNCPAPDCMDGG